MGNDYMLNQDIQDTKKKLFEESLNLKILDSLITVVSEGAISSEQELIKKEKNWGKSTNWETCLVTLRYKSFRDASLEAIIEKDTEILYHSNGSAFRMGPWVERFKSYADEVRNKYIKEEETKAQKEKEKELQPFLNIDF